MQASLNKQNSTQNWNKTIISDWLCISILQLLNLTHFASNSLTYISQTCIYPRSLLTANYKHAFRNQQHINNKHVTPPPPHSLSLSNKLLEGSPTYHKKPSTKVLESLCSAKLQGRNTHALLERVSLYTTPYIALIFNYITSSYFKVPHGCLSNNNVFI